MSHYEIYLRRNCVEYRCVRVESASPEAARRRALAIARDDATAVDGEDEGEWCDTSYGRSIVHSVKPVAQRVQDE